MVASPRIALITGAGSGIGRATAQAFWNGGYTVVLAGRSEEKLRETAEDAGVYGARALIVPTDVSDRRAVVELFATIKSAYGRLDVLFNNAGISAIADPVETISEEDWLAVVGVNLNGAFWCIQEAFKLMKSQHPTGWSHHQQRLFVHSRSSPQVRALYRDQARLDRIDQVDRAGWQSL